MIVWLMTGEKVPFLYAKNIHRHFKRKCPCKSTDIFLAASRPLHGDIAGITSFYHLRFYRAYLLLFINDF